LSEVLYYYIILYSISIYSIVNGHSSRLRQIPITIVYLLYGHQNRFHTEIQTRRRENEQTKNKTTDMNRQITKEKLNKNETVDYNFGKYYIIQFIHIMLVYYIRYLYVSLFSV